MLYSLYMVSLSFLYSSFFYVNVTGSFVPPNGDEPADVVRQIICLRFISVYYYYSPARPYLILDPSRCSYLVTIRPRKIRKKEKKRSLFVCLFFLLPSILFVYTGPSLRIIYLNFFDGMIINTKKAMAITFKSIVCAPPLTCCSHTKHDTEEK